MRVILRDGVMILEDADRIREVHAVLSAVQPSFGRVPLEGHAAEYAQTCISASTAGLPDVPALTCGRNGNGGDDAADTPKRAAGAKRIRREGLQHASAPVSFSG